ncbi:TniQ family protein [Polynucleobacter sp. Fuers-14]|uniref:TniQ family protein n=1 Tax=Polynucleobacter sp. Fuers-14 TaxID=1758364 RepID=UPI001C0D946A|nr:TniQ family protein [Polynucleobacter sp. Fuers-14]MBU3641909.1 TniQ family protein [Polynucleobacter sp. Fuers-14]
MEEKFSTLYNVPRLIATESMSSWITRLALSQGASMTTILRYLEISKAEDMDRLIGKQKIKHISKKSGMPMSDFKGLRTIFKSLISIDPSGRNFLLFSDKKSRYRFCPVCLKKDDVPYFRVEWRFNVWRSCPDHGCLLEDECNHCKQSITLPTDMLRGGPKRSGIGTLAMCANCGEWITKVKPAYHDFSGSRSLDAEDNLLIQNGKAFLSALYFEYFNIDGFKKTYVTKEFLRLHKKNIFPWHSFKWTAKLWRDEIS